MATFRDLLKQADNRTTDHGTNISGNITLNVSDSLLHKLTIVGNTTIFTQGWINNEISELVIEIRQGGLYSVTWNNTIGWIDFNGNLITSLAELGRILNSDPNVPDFIMLWSTDGGATIFGKVLR